MAAKRFTIPSLVYIYDNYELYHELFLTEALALKKMREKLIEDSEIWESFQVHMPEAEKHGATKTSRQRFLATVSDDDLWKHNPFEYEKKPVRSAA